MHSKKNKLKLEKFDQQELRVISAQFGQFASAYLERLSDLEAIGLSSAAPIWIEGPKIFEFDTALETAFRETELQRVERSITDWALTPDGAAIMQQRIEQHELYRQTGDLSDRGLSASSLHLEQLRERSLGGYARTIAQLEDKVMEARCTDMDRLGLEPEGGSAQGDAPSVKRVVVCALVEEQGLGYEREPKAGGFISFNKPLCDGWLLRIRIVESDLLRSSPVRWPSGRLHFATHKMHLEVVDVEQNRYASFLLEDLVPIKNALCNNVYSRVYDSPDQLLFVVQSSVLAYSVVASEFESCLLRGIEQLDQIRNS